MTGPQIYIIDDDLQVAEMVQDILMVHGYESIIFTHARDFLDLSISPEHIVLIDLVMPDIDGIEVLRELAERGSKNPIILLSGYDKGVLGSAEKLGREKSLNIIKGVTKPIDAGALLAVITNLYRDSYQKQAEKFEALELNLSCDELQEAIDQQQLTLHYQPQINLKSGAMTGVEALVRWQHPKFGLLPPGLFLPFAESSDLMGQLTTQVFSMAIEQGEHWINEGLTTHISVNISADNINILTLPEKLSNMLESRALNSTMLTLEITESSLMQELSTSLDILTRLRMKGFGLSIDDFGTGYSSLSQLHKIPFSELKIDQSFVMTMDQDLESKAIVKTCIVLGHELNMDVVAEGVESETILNQLMELGCDFAQGYHIAKPMSPEDLLAWSRAREP